jgi:hypothetical protein
MFRYASVTGIATIGYLKNLPEFSRHIVDRYVSLSDDGPADQVKRTLETLIWHMPNDTEYRFPVIGDIGKLQVRDHELLQVICWTSYHHSSIPFVSLAWGYPSKTRPR